MSCLLRFRLGSGVDTWLLLTSGSHSGHIYDATEAQAQAEATPYAEAETCTEAAPYAEAETYTEAAACALALLYKLTVPSSLPPPAQRSDESSDHASAPDTARTMTGRLNEAWAVQIMALSLALALTWTLALALAMTLSLTVALTLTRALSLTLSSLT